MRRAIYPGSFRSGDQRPSRRDRTRSQAVRRGARGRGRQQPEAATFHRGRAPGDARARLPPRTATRSGWCGWKGLLVDYARTAGAGAIIRGLRAVSDFEFEFQMALMNRKLEANVETIFLMPKEEYTYLSSRIIKEIARLGGEVGQFCARLRHRGAQGEIPFAGARSFTMKIHLRQIPDEGLHLEGEEPAAGARPARRMSTCARSGRSSIALDLGLSADGLWATGEMFLEVELRCVRCLEPFAYPAGGARCCVANRTARVRETVDLTPELREDMILALPSYPHCDWSGERVCPGRQKSRRRRRPRPVRVRTKRFPPRFRLGNARPARPRRPRSPDSTFVLTTLSYGSSQT